MNRILKPAYTLLFMLTLLSRPAWADLRFDVMSALVNLRKEGLFARFPEEMKNLDDTFAAAERYFQKNDRQNAELYYRLALQKAKVIEYRYRKPENVGGASNAEPDAAAPGESSAAEVPVPPEESSPLIMETDMPRQATAQDELDFLSNELVGTIGEYTVLPKDTLRLVSAKLGVTRAHLAKMNGIDPQASLKTGQKLRYNNLKIIPYRMKDGILVNIPDRTLYFFRQGRLEASLPVALGIARKNSETIWRTPTGRFRITGKQKDPTWRVPPSIQEEMREEGKQVITEVLPGPNNPLGKYAIKTSIPGILIHSTSKPSSIYSFSSHGCIRMYPDHIESFFKEVKVNTQGEIIYRPVKLAVTEKGRIMLEVHQDVYEKVKGLEAEARRLLKKNNVEQKVDWRKVEAALKLKEGIATDVTQDILLTDAR